MTMRGNVTRLAVAVLAAGLLLLFPAFAQKPKPDQFSGVWLNMSAGPRASIDINIVINRYTTDEEMKKFAEILVEGGGDALRRALEKEDVGQISPTGRVGTPIAVARKFVNGNKTTIRVATARSMSWLELRYSGRSTDYPFTIVQLNLDENGKGEGTGIAAAKVSFDKKKNVYEIESLQHGTAYNKIMNVQTWK
jgi:hypothetical protein